MLKFCDGLSAGEKKSGENVMEGGKEFGIGRNSGKFGFFSSFDVGGSESVETSCTEAKGGVFKSWFLADSVSLGVVVGAELGPRGVVSLDEPPEVEEDRGVNSAELPELYETRLCLCRESRITVFSESGLCSFTYNFLEALGKDDIARDGVSVRDGLFEGENSLLRSEISGCE